MNPTPGDETWRGKWPQRVPRCPTSTSLSEATEYSDSDSEKKDSISRLRSRTFIYRNRKGKKTKVSEMMMQTIGAMMESESEEETEATREHTCKQLKHARTFVEQKVAELWMAELSLLSDT